MSDLGPVIRLSLLVGVAATLAAALPALALGWLLARRHFPGKALVTTAVFVPMVVPPVIVGWMMLSLLGRDAVLGRALARLGLEIPFSAAGAVVAALIVSFPFFVVAARFAFEAVDTKYEEVAQSLGFTPWRTFLRVTLPLAAPGLLGGAVLAFARALGEFGATIVIAGNIEGRTQTIALAIYSLLESPGGESRIHQLVLVSVGIALAALALYEVLNRWQRRRLR